ncbi:MAG TPA: hypothetical protein VNW97_20955 [Candidatus Saccharimonadales bacterium]|jgi:hypothetical protein|nr:hypothetical protein [Candidatus Saccharimonadales bacterium]
MIMKRVRNKAVTQISILVPCGRNEQHGVATFLFEGRAPKPVRVVTDADFREGSKGHHKTLGTMQDYEIEQFMAVLMLLRALTSKDKLAIAYARERVTKAHKLKREADKKSGLALAQEDDLDFGRVLIPMFGLAAGQEKEALARWNGYQTGPGAQADHRWLLSQLMSQALESARLVLWWSGSRFQPAIYCGELKAALYTFLLMKLAMGQGWGVCPKCGAFFVQKRSDQNYCSMAHREAHRVARWRASKKTDRKKKRGGK